MFQLTNVLVLRDEVVIFSSLIILLTPNGNFWIMLLLHSMWSVIQIQVRHIGHPDGIFMAFLSLSKVMPGLLLIRPHPHISNLSFTSHPTTQHCVA